VLSEILRGGAERITEAGAALLGGHSVRDAEIKYGLAVTGLIDPTRIVTNAGAKPGDVLVLTKPIGSGTLVTAAKNGRIPESDLAEAIDVMVTLNASASEAMQHVGVHAATDITGFGLLGHAFEMAEGGGVTLQLEAATVPLLARALELARAGIATRAWKSNLEHPGTGLRAEGIEPAMLTVLADAQTSGGLLISVAAGKADGLLRALADRGVRSAAVVGRVLARSDCAVLLD